jgi:L-histidine N-alpha-methyltransferase
MSQSISAERSDAAVSQQQVEQQHREEILLGLAADPKRLSPKFFYDQRGSELFDQICDLPEYYLTRTEMQIMDRYLTDVSARVGPNAAIIEFGAGSNQKVRQLLEYLVDPGAYVPVEISGDYLEEQAQELAADFPRLSIKPVVADFTQPFELPTHDVMPSRNLVFFPGSTIGNFTRRQARDLLSVMCSEAKPGGALLIGVDLRKDVALIEAAYNDEQGVTAEFNRNVLRVLNNEHDATFEVDAFRHEAVFDDEESRIEMRLVSTKPQTVSVYDRDISFRKDEYIITEYSHKYSIAGFTALAREAGFEPEACYTDDDEMFSLHYMTVPMAA